MNKKVLFLDEPDCTEQALKTFEKIDSCIYTKSHLGISSNEFMECDCVENYSDGVNHSCDENSDCINRLTLIECVNSKCNYCGDNCQNQRFQKHEYSNISIFQTEMKGFGVRANENLEINQFIYEYIGEVIDDDEFHKRMINYDQRGEKHFYFMMLKSGEFIDATEKGNLGRFCNHSCNPNAYVNKWLVGDKLKMGIFAKRPIDKGEEITFDYNVDRYGASPQKCYCGEANCLGFLGGKTQTDAALLLPQIYAQALGVNRSMEKRWIKDNKIDVKAIINVTISNDNINKEFVEQLDVQPCDSGSDITKVMSVLLQLEDNSNIILLAEKLLKRISPLNKEENRELIQQVIKLHGYKCFSRLLPIFIKHNEINLIETVLIILNNLPKTTRNGIINSNLVDRINDIEEKIPELSNICNQLIEKWSSFEMYTQITKNEIKRSSSSLSSSSNLVKNGTSTKFDSRNDKDFRKVRLPPGWEILQENGRPVYYNAKQQTKLHYPPAGITKVFSQNNLDSHSHNYHNHHHHNGNINNKKRLYSHTISDKSENMNGNNNNTNGGVLSEEELKRRKQERIEKERIALERAKTKEIQELKANLQLEHEKKNELERIIAHALQKKPNVSTVTPKSPGTPNITNGSNGSVPTPHNDTVHSNVEKPISTEDEKLIRTWNKFFAMIVPNMLKKYEKENHLKHSTAKNLSRDIVKILTKKEVQHNNNRSPPAEITKDKKLKVYKFVNGYMSKWFLKERRNHN
ncbi:hypothetical protein TBLA_0J01040 [Henningerozyma blattae CBS 6284]|uniref:Histone-lysine N-methyltransferase, H3 lysine-36 specific n=1 Tax=Henningerozyma blattae (strain ATCC 34711 / CBS 6284 / DSM 70876 / NBRC 10599 / NRRL Y-10934 / UCD 77-7) TaxID=1071380 RepID=I2H9Q0_HENB6|nr:hypothetical protein TBLA_0J01040 [Tetrapisispora blattae CBS 6284]CCH63102.1 hypothetical protein TBLA_0J01040 [Tetrapisispora blattae CBS 6284]